MPAARRPDPAGRRPALRRARCRRSSTAPSAPRWPRRRVTAQDALAHLRDRAVTHGVDLVAVATAVLDGLGRAGRVAGGPGRADSPATPGRTGRSLGRTRRAPACEVRSMPVSDPDILPLLSRGRHRSPRKGACFMELAGFLAGERWSDHPACTHPLLARLARGVNDVTSDDARPRLAPLIPSVIGLTSTDPLWDHAISVVAASAALPLAPEERQRALAVGILTCDRLLARAEDRAARSADRPRRIRRQICRRVCRRPGRRPCARPRRARRRAARGTLGPTVRRRARRRPADPSPRDGDRRLLRAGHRLVRPARHRRGPAHAPHRRDRGVPDARRTRRGARPGARAVRLAGRPGAPPAADPPTQDRAEPDPTTW